MTLSVPNGAQATISNISISAIKTSDFPIQVPFIDVDTPVQATYYESKSVPSIQGYILKKLPTSIYEMSPHYLIATCDYIYPEDSQAVHMSLFNMVSGLPDYCVYTSGNDNYVYANNGTLGYIESGRYYSVAVINGEICICGRLTNNQMTLSDLVSSCPDVCATLY